MATLEVNTRKIKIDSNDYLNIKSLIPKVQKKFPLENFTLNNLKINGELVSIDSDNYALTRPILNEDHIEVTFSASDKFTLNIINEIPTIIDKIIAQLINCSHKIELDNPCDYELACIIENIDVFLHTMNSIYQGLNKSNEYIESLPIKELQIHLLSVMKGIHASHQKQDHIMLTDLLEYELKDNLTQWKILIVPTLKKAAASFS